MVLGRFMVEPLGDDSTFLNSVAIAQPSFCVPDLRGHWQLMEPGRQRVEGTISRAQVLDRLDVTSILDVGNSVREVLTPGGTWLDALDVSPLVPGMSERAELQEFETLLADISAQLIAVGSARLGETIESALEAVRLLFRADRCALCDISDDLETVRFAYIAHAEGVSKILDDLNLARLFPWTERRVVVDLVPLAVPRLRLLGEVLVNTLERARD